MKLGLTAAGQRAYLERMFGSHDFQIQAEVLNLDEKVIGEAILLDGQINLQGGSGVRRTGSFVLADPDNALAFDADSLWQGSMWADRLLRITHSLEVPGEGRVSVVAFVGPPSVLSRSGGEITVECQDKTALAIRGSKPMAVREGSNAVAAIKKIMTDCTGEFRFRFPSSSKARLRRNYSVGWADDASPWVTCQRIAASLDWQLVYEPDGALTLRPLPSKPVVRFNANTSITDLPDTSVDFTTAANHVRVSGSKKGVIATKTLYAHPLSPGRLARRGVPRFLPLLIEESYTKDSQAAARAQAEAKRLGRLSERVSANVVPVFHLTSDDPVALVTDDGSIVMRVTEASIPVGVGGEMTIGTQKVVSRLGSIRG
jgi:hypothetical protein